MKAYNISTIELTTSDSIKPPVDKAECIQLHGTTWYNVVLLVNRSTACSLTSVLEQ